MARCFIVVSTILILAQANARNAIADLIVDNFSESENAGGYLFRHPFVGNTSNTWGQSFDTGGDDYSLDSISVALTRSHTQMDFTAKLWTKTANSLPDTSVLDFSLANSPTANGFQTYKFTPDNLYVLDGATQYYFTLEDNLAGASSWRGTTQATNNFSGPGTIYSRVSSSNNSGATWQSGAGGEAVIRVEGTLAAVPEPSSYVLIGILGAAAAFRRSIGDNVMRLLTRHI